MVHVFCGELVEGWNRLLITEEISYYRQVNTKTRLELMRSGFGRHLVPVGHPFPRLPLAGTWDQTLCYNPHPRGKTTLTNLSGIVKQLSKERDRLHQQLSGLNAALHAFAGIYRGDQGRPRRKMSSKGRARIAAAQRARWAKAKGITVVPTKRTMSASARRKIAAAQRARWAKVKRGKKAA